jgi:hypothetical protein
MRVLEVVQVDTYFNVGLRNATGRSIAHPAYKMLVGREVQASVRPSEGKTFAPGHALARLESDETRGVGTKNGRVWAIKRANLSEFRSWCETVADGLAKKGAPKGLPQLAFLASPSRFEELQGKPLAILLDEDVFLTRCVISCPADGAAPVLGDTLPSIASKGVRKGVLAAEFYFHSTIPPILLTYSPAQQPCWQQNDQRALTILLDSDVGVQFSGSLPEFLGAYPPLLVLPTGGVVVNRERWIPAERPGRLPAGVLLAMDWAGCDVRKEISGAKEGLLPIQDWLAAKLVTETSRSAVIVKDHGAGEMADFIVVEPSTNPRLITLYHCKGSSGDLSSDRVDDCYEVLGQALRSSQWILNPTLLDRIEIQTRPPRSSAILKGSAASLRNIAADFASNAWNYRIVVVQPGLKTGIMEDSRKIALLVVSAYEAIRQFNGEFTIWGT